MDNLKRKHYLQRHIFQWHHYCGLLVGAFLLLMSITGSILVFSDELELSEKKELPEIISIAGRPSFDSSFLQIQKKYPDYEIRIYHLPQPNEPLIYDLRQKEKRTKIFTHPVSGNILSVNEKANDSFQRNLLLLHYTLFAGTTGKIIVFVTGTLFLISIITGIIIYRKSIFKVLSFRIHFTAKTIRSLNSSLHRIVGVWSLFFNILIVVTGLCLSWQVVTNALKNPSNGGVKTVSTSISSLDSVVQKITNAYPDFEINQIRIRPHANIVQLSGRLNSDPSYYGNYGSSFSVNGATLKIEKKQFLKDMPITDRFMKLCGPLHFGNYGGILLKIFYCLFGMTPALLSLSGFVIWRKKQRLKSLRVHGFTS